jgi:NADH-quinone oxidoreductase subunit L
MTIPLMILAFASVFGGFIPFNEFITTDGKPFEAHLDYAVAIPSVLVALVGIGIATVLYKKESEVPVKISKSFGAFYRWAFNKFYIDEIYFFVTKVIIFKFISRPVAWFDRHIVDGFMNMISWITNYVAEQIKGFQSGKVQQYGFVFVIGAIVLVIVFAYLTKV